MTLIEILVVLAIMAMATAVIMPSTSRMLDQATSHAVFFEFQRQVSELRRQANRTGEDLRLVDPDMRGPKGAADRVALPVSGDDAAHKAAVIGLLDELGFDAVTMAGSTTAGGISRQRRPIAATRISRA